MAFLRNLFGSPKPNTDPLPSTPTSTVSAKPLTTYLGSLLKEAGVTDIRSLPYDGKKVNYAAYPSLQPRRILGRYEAGLTQASYMSRLCYTANIRKMCGVNFINHTPIVFNTALSIMRRNINLYRDEVEGAAFNASPYVGPAQILYDKTKTHETPCYMQVVDYTRYNGPSPYPGERILYVTFRGTLSLKSAFLTDANITTRSAMELLGACSMEGMPGTDAFRAEIAEAENYRFAPGIHPFGIHQGFILNLQGIIGRICQTLEGMLKSTPIDRIIVTGHSLGAANATVASLVFAGFKRAGVPCLQGPKIHCMTFGAPKLFLDYTRLVYNRLLSEGILTLDRVAGRMENLVAGMASAGVAIDLVPTIPPNLVHPGYMILKQEFKTQSRTGRSKNISDIREMFGLATGGAEGAGTNAGAKSGALNKLKAYTIGALQSYSEFNGLPYYAEFLECFEGMAGVTAESYEKRLMNLPFATIYKVPGADNTVYEGVKRLVEATLGKGAADSSAEGDKQEAAEEGAKEKQMEDAAPALNASNAEGLKGGAFSFVSKAKQEYEAATLENGPNHVVYNCKKNISPFSCHLAYMGVGYGGLSGGDIGYSPPAHSMFNVADGKITYHILKLGGRRQRKTMRQRQHQHQRQQRRRVAKTHRKRQMKHSMPSKK